MDADTVKRIDDKELGELSCGYRAVWVPDSGVWGGESYEYRQTRIRGNHIALLGKNEGRAGPTVRLYGMDGIGHVLDSKDLPQVEKPQMADQQILIGRQIITVSADAHAVLAPYVEEVSTNDAKMEDMSGKMKDMEAKMKAKDEEIAKLKGERDGYKSELDKFKKDSADSKKTDEEIAKQVSDAVTERLTLLDTARKVTMGSKVEFAATDSARDIRVKAIKVCRPDLEVADDADINWISGVFSTLKIADSGSSDNDKPNIPPVISADDARKKMIADLNTLTDDN